MMKKKVLALLLAGVMAAGATACGSASKGQTVSGNEENSSSVAEVESSVDWSGDISLYVPANAGGGTDMMARTMAQGVSDVAGNNINVLNNTDGGGVVALETVRTAAPDGKNLLQYGLIVLVNSAMGKYDHNIEEEFSVIAAAPADNTGDQVLVAAKDSQYQTLDDLKNASGEVLFGVQLGGSTHVVSAMITKALGINAKFVEAGSDTEKLTALVGKNIDVCVVGVNQAQQYVESGMVNALGFVSASREGDQRSERIPDVESFVEQGYEDVVWGGMQLILGPKGMDENLIEKINQCYMDAYPSCKEALDGANLGMQFKNVEESKQLVEEYSEKIENIVTELDLSAEK